MKAPIPTVTRSNIYQLRPNANAPTWRTRVVAAATYLFFAYQFPRVQTGELVNLLLLLGILYWAFVHQRKGYVPYFVRYHWLQCIVLMMFLGVGLELLQAVCGLVDAGLHMLSLAWLLPWGMVSSLVYVGGALLKCLSMVVLAITASLGKTPDIPVISTQVKHWA